MPPTAGGSRPEPTAEGWWCGGSERGSPSGLSRSPRRPSAPGRASRAPSCGSTTWPGARTDRTPPPRRAGLRSWPKRGWEASFPRRSRPRGPSRGSHSSVDGSWRWRPTERSAGCCRWRCLRAGQRSGGPGRRSSASVWHRTARALRWGTWTRPSASLQWVLPRPIPVAVATPLATSMATSMAIPPEQHTATTTTTTTRARPTSIGWASARPSGRSVLAAARGWRRWGATRFW
mmetsp:Transcript_12778/g.27096  ORF Transcript_12778/g.27096 Transcript_12778/m.27096 type:complete len:233 (-) Transcript_12778:801-1499(-)